jgi:plasmid stabilization system protein ParE
MPACSFSGSKTPSPTFRRKIHRQSHWIVYRRLPSDPDTLEIIAIAHERRGEEYWEQRFKGM